MPFQSEQQRKYLWANEPEIAKRWEKYPKGYNTGGVSHLFRTKSAKGGYIRPEDSGVLGLADGGRTGFFTGMREQEQRQQQTQHRERPDVLSSPVSQPSYDPTPTRDDRQTYSPHTDTPTQIAEQKQLDIAQDIERREEEKEDYVAPPKKNIFQKAIDYVKKNPLEAVLNVASFGGYEAATQLLNAMKLAKGAKKFSESEIGMAFTTKFSEWGDEMKKHNAKIDLINSLPKGHPERIQLEESLNYGPYQTTPERDGEGGVEDIMAVEDVNIKIDNVSQLNEDKARLASLELMERNRQQSKENAKRLAYLAAFRQKYLMGPTAMAAQGGRVPQGYNTGGLSNLFRLKNK